MKTATTLEAAVAMIPDGATLMIGGSSASAHPGA
jgi:acyl CoA:acetate/3-ketoacid CoA transferase alpha subunit